MNTYTEKENEMIKISKAFEKACETNNLDEIKIILENNEEMPVNSETFNDGFVAASAAGSIDVAEYLYDFSTPNEYSLKEAFRCACDMSKLESIKFLVFKTSLKRKDVQEHIVEVKGYDVDFYQNIQNVFKEKMSMYVEE